MIDMKLTGLNINRKLEEKKISIREVSETMGFCSTRSVYKWLSGITLPSIESFLILSDLLECSINDLIVKG